MEELKGTWSKAAAVEILQQFGDFIIHSLVESQISPDDKQNEINSKIQPPKTKKHCRKGDSQGKCGFECISDRSEKWDILQVSDEWMMGEAWTNKNTER